MKKVLKCLDVCVFILIIYLISILVVSTIYSYFVLEIEALGLYLTGLFVSLVFLRILFYLLTYKNKKLPRKVIFRAVALFSVGSFGMLIAARQIAVNAPHPLLNVAIFVFALMWVVVAMSTFWGQAEYVNTKQIKEDN